MKKILTLLFISLMVLISGCLTQEVSAPPQVITTIPPTINSLDELKPYSAVCKNEVELTEINGEYGKNYGIICFRNVTHAGLHFFLEKRILFGHLLEDLSLSKDEVVTEMAMDTEYLSHLSIFPEYENLKIHKEDDITYLIGINIYLCGECKKGDVILMIEPTAWLEGETSHAQTPTSEDIRYLLNLGK